ncbi:hypothetical protein LTR53_006397 [Teratosphaeriaceae sp. CCFEE 6253]|nr:hypothetical protein LTR53_006397 [Teratosphaeriaceae sp. CCFEE 6253]
MAALTLIRPTTGRAVHLRVTPRPSNIGESREILRLISQFGEVEYFKSLKYEALPAANTAVVIFREEDAARQCLKRSPVRFRMGKAPPTVALDVGSKTAVKADTRLFQIQADPARANFRDLLNHSHFHGSFMVDSKLAAQGDLERRVPNVGLSDINWRGVEKPWAVVDREKEADAAYKGSGRRKSLQAIYDESG